MTQLPRALVADVLARAYIDAVATTLRIEDETKVDELVPFLDEIDRFIRRASAKRPFVLVDAAAGKGYVGVLAAALLLGHRPDAHVHLVERDEGRLRDAERAARRLDVRCAVSTHATDVDDRTSYPEEPSLVVALHACGDATDRVLDRALDVGARALLVVPCCVSSSTRGTALGRAVHRSLGLPDEAPIARRTIHAVVDGERILRLEAAGYETEAIEVFPPHVSPYNVGLRARRVREPVRMARAATQLEALRRRFGGSPIG